MDQETFKYKTIFSDLLYKTKRDYFIDVNGSLKRIKTNDRVNMCFYTYDNDKIDYSDVQAIKRTDKETGEFLLYYFSIKNYIKRA